MFGLGVKGDDPDKCWDKCWDMYQFHDGSKDEEESQPISPAPQSNPTVNACGRTAETNAQVQQTLVGKVDERTTPDQLNGLGRAALTRAYNDLAL